MTKALFCIGVVGVYYAALSEKMNLGYDFGVCGAGIEDT